MALMHCPECNKEVSDKAKACPNCGYPISLTDENSSKNSNLGEGNLVRKEAGIIDIFGGYKISKKVECPHCRKIGCVLTRKREVKKGISGGKATGAIFTGGLSLLVTGLSRKEKVMQAKCKNCKSEWTF